MKLLIMLLGFFISQYANASECVRAYNHNYNGIAFKSYRILEKKTIYFNTVSEVDKAMSICKNRLSQTKCELFQIDDFEKQPLNYYHFISPEKTILLSSVSECEEMRLIDARNRIKKDMNLNLTPFKPTKKDKRDY